MANAPSSPPAEVLAAYHVSSDIRVEPLGKGNINDTFLVDEGEQRFVLQRINGQVFPDPQRVITNFAIVSEHIRAKAKLHGINFSCAVPVKTIVGEYGLRDSLGNHWRAQSFVEHLPTSQVSSSSTTAEKLGQALAHFHLLTEDLSPTLLSAPLLHFHSTPRYLSQLESIAKKSNNSEDDLLVEALCKVEQLRLVAGRLEEAYSKGQLSRRVVHGDPKLDNVIVSPEGKVCGFFDLDTTGPGLLHYDLGDCLRSSCNSAGEEEENFSEVKFDLEKGASLVEGYCLEAGESLTRIEREMIYDAVLVISFELGVRFLTDHLQGDSYFKVLNRGDNLLRALGQLHLAVDISRREKVIREALSF